MNVTPDLVVMEEPVRIYPEVIDVNADKVTLEGTARSVSVCQLV